MSETKPSAGALRAAEEIESKCLPSGRWGASVSNVTVARIIDRETHAPAPDPAGLAEALENAADTFAETGKVLRLLRHNTAAEAMTVAELGCRAALDKWKARGA